MDAVFRALSDPHRRRILDELCATNAQAQGRLGELLGLSRQAIRKHLVVLEAAKLVTTARYGRLKMHYINPAPLRRLEEDWLHKFTRLDEFHEGLRQSGQGEMK